MWKKNKVVDNYDLVYKENFVIIIEFYNVYEYLRFVFFKIVYMIYINFFIFNNC